MDKIQPTVKSYGADGNEMQVSISFPNGPPPQPVAFSIDVIKPKHEDIKHLYSDKPLHPFSR